jgi:hypothetical protein
MSSPDAAQKLEQARALIEDAKAVFEIRSSADAVLLLVVHAR